MTNCIDRLLLLEKGDVAIVEVTLGRHITLDETFEDEFDDLEKGGYGRRDVGGGKEGEEERVRT
jgi:hypothetical protein